MTNQKQDPELFENNEEGTGDESAYTEDNLEYNGDQFELDNEFEYVEEDNGN